MLAGGHYFWLPGCLPGAQRSLLDLPPHEGSRTYHVRAGRTSHAEHMRTSSVACRDMKHYSISVAVSQTRWDVAFGRRLINYLLGEYQHLLEDAGFVLTRIVSTSTAFSILEARPV